MVQIGVFGPFFLIYFKNTRMWLTEQNGLPEHEDLDAAWERCDDRCLLTSKCTRWKSVAEIEAEKINNWFHVFFDSSPRPLHIAANPDPATWIINKRSISTSSLNGKSPRATSNHKTYLQDMNDHLLHHTLLIPDSRNQFFIFLFNSMVCSCLLSVMNLTLLALPPQLLAQSVSTASTIIAGSVAKKHPLQMKASATSQPSSEHVETSSHQTPLLAPLLSLSYQRQITETAVSLNYVTYIIINRKNSLLHYFVSSVLW